MKVDPDKYFYKVQSGQMVPFGFVPGVDMTTLHYGMFAYSLQTLGSEEQIAKWNEDVQTLRMTGCYAQTELGHGSNVASLETTATLDMKTDEFVIHSPTVTSTKYWPGGLGLTANHALVFARCIVEENDIGVQPFMVQIREFETHMPRKGIKVGDIGPKLGYNAKDNGWLMFDQVRVPRTNMLCKFAYIDKDGAMEIRGNPRAIYQTMVEIRY
jgi:acyl-CoA oxidase